jgi:AcrR family transcriptional regulator
MYHSSPQWPIDVNSVAYKRMRRGFAAGRASFTMPRMNLKQAAPGGARRRPAPVTDARMLRTRASLRRALLVLLERKPLDQISIRDIAAEAGIGYATFFRHHASKEALLDEIAAEQIAQLVEATLPVLDGSNTRVACLAMCRHVGQHRALWSALLSGAPATLRREFTRLVQLGAAQVRNRGWLPVELGVVYGVSACIEILGWCLRRPQEYGDEQIAEIIDRLVVTPAFAGAGPQAKAAAHFAAPGTRTPRR